MEVDGQLGRLPDLGEAAEGPERLLQVGEGLAVGRPRHGPEPRLAEIGDRLLPQLPAQGVVGQPLGLLGDALGREPLDGLGDAGVQGALPVVEQPLVRHLVRERVLERVLEVRKEPGLVEELRGLEVGELGAHLGLRRVGNGQEQREGHVLADDRGGLEQPLGLGRQAVDARGQDGLHGGGDRQVLDGPGEPVGAALAGQGRRLHQGPHALLEEEGIRFRPLDQEPLERAECRVGAEERLEQLVGALGRQGIDPELAVVGLAAPGVPVLGPVVDEEQEARRGQALDEAVEQGLGLAVDPVQVLEDHHQRLDLALAQQQALDRVERLLAPLERIEGLPGRLVHRHVEERQEGGHDGRERRGERQDLPGDLLPDLPRVVAALDREVAAQQLDHGQVGRGLAVGDRGRLPGSASRARGGSG